MTDDISNMKWNQVIDFSASGKVGGSHPRILLFGLTADQKQTIEEIFYSKVRRFLILIEHVPRFFEELVLSFRSFEQIQPSNACILIKF